MRIVIDLTALHDNFSGIERYALNMTLALLENDRENDYVLIFKGEIYPSFYAWKKEKRVGMKVLKPCNKLLFNQWRLPMYLNRISADCFLFFAFPMPLLLRKKNVFATIHDMGCWDCPETMKSAMSWYFKISYRNMARRADRIITISEFSRERIQKILKVSNRRILVAYCGLSESFAGEYANALRPEADTEVQDRVRKKYGLPEEYYLCLSTLEPRKNMSLLLRVYLKLYREGKIHTRLVLAGRKGWKIDEMLADIDAEGKNQVVVTGFIEEEDLPCIYRMAKCFVFPSIYEGFGIPPLEAMAEGVPVLASDAACMPEILGDGALYFRDRSEDDLAAKLLCFEKNQVKDIDKLIQRGYKKSQEYRYGKESKKIIRKINKLRK